MHQGVQAFIEWIGKKGGSFGVSMNPGATSAEFARIETLIGAPLPQDLRIVLSHFNGGSLPSGHLMQVGAPGPDTIQGALSTIAGQIQKPISDPDLMLPFFLTDEQSILAFDRSAAPISDTWPIVDYSVDTGVRRLVFRTFDGWCRFSVADWTSADFDQAFSLEKYLNRGLRHVAIEPDVSIAHATVAHALRRFGEPERALQSYLKAGRCVPSQPWCDWEALKLAVLLRDDRKAIEAATRLCSRAPEKRWVERETTPVMVADVIGQIACNDANGELVLRLFDQLSEQSNGKEDKRCVSEVRKAVFSDKSRPPTHPIRPTAVPPRSDKREWWEALKQAYRAGEVRDDDLLLDPAYRALGSEYDFVEILRTYREF
jgi:hypothetical protein